MTVKQFMKELEALLKRAEKAGLIFKVTSKVPLDGINITIVKEDEEKQ